MEAGGAPTGATRWPYAFAARPSSEVPFGRSFGLERSRQDVVWRLELDALRRRDGRRKGSQERRPAVVDLPPHQHGVVLVHRVVAVLHEHPAPIAELHGDG